LVAKQVKGNTKTTKIAKDTGGAQRAGF